LSVPGDIRKAFGFPLGEPSIEPFAGKAKDVPEVERCSTAMHRSFYENTNFAVHFMTMP
jgi:hypothetical protein